LSKNPIKTSSAAVTILLSSCLPMNINWPPAWLDRNYYRFVTYLCTWRLHVCVRLPVHYIVIITLSSVVAFYYLHYTNIYIYRFPSIVAHYNITTYPSPRFLLFFNKKKKNNKTKQNGPLLVYPLYAHEGPRTVPAYRTTMMLH